MWQTTYQLFEVRTSWLNKTLILCLKQDNKTDYLNEYIKAMQDQIPSLKSEVMFLITEVKQRKRIHWTK